MEVYEDIYDSVSDTITRRKQRNGGKYVDNFEGNNVTNFEPLYLLDRFYPLRKKMMNKFFNKCNQFIQPEDLAAQIDVEFLDLVNSYDKTRGVDFPFYIQQMLNYRIWHFTDKITKSSMIEVPMDDNISGHSEARHDEKPEITFLPDEDAETVLDIVDALNSVDGDIMEIPFNEKLIKSVLSEGKSLEDLSEELDIPLKTLNKQFSDLCDKLYARAAVKEKEENRIQKFQKEADNIFKSLKHKKSIVRKPIKRVPIMDDESWNEIDWSSFENNQ